MKKLKFLLCFVILILIFTINNCPSAQANTAYQNYVQSLPIELESILIAKDNYIKTHSINGNKQENLQDFLVYMEKYKQINKESRVLNKYYGRFLGEYNSWDDNQEQEYLDKYSKYGFLIGHGEGLVWARINYVFFKEGFSEYLPQDWQAYLNLKSLESKHQNYNDGAYCLTYPQTRERIIAYDNFIKQYPQFANSKEIKQALKESVKSYLGLHKYSFLLHGNIKKSTLDEYKQFIQNNSNNIYQSVVLTMYNYLIERVEPIQDKESFKIVGLESNSYYKKVNQEIEAIRQ